MLLTMLLPSRVSLQMMDMGTNSAKAVRAQIATVKLDFFCYDVPLVRLGLGGQISFVPGGIKPEMEFSVKIGMGAAGKGILVEVSPNCRAPVSLELSAYC